MSGFDPEITFVAGILIGMLLGVGAMMVMDFANRRVNETMEDYPQD